MRFAWTLCLCLLTPFWVGVDAMTVTDCVAQGATTICFGFDDSAGDSDWFVEVRSESGKVRRHTERLPYEQEARRVAVSIASGWIVYVVHSRWLDEFSIALETKWELVLFDAGGSLRTRIDLPGKPDGLFDLAGHLFASFPDGTYRTYDRNLTKTDGLPPILTLRLPEAMAISASAEWMTPSGDPDVFSGVGHYRLKWTDADGSLFLAVTVAATITGFFDEAVSEGPIAFVSDAWLVVDQEPPALSGTIDAPGGHRIVVTGQNGYRLEWNVLVKPSLYGLPTTMSTQTVRLYSNALMKINGEPYAPGTPIEKAGTYELVLVCAGGYRETHAFAIASNAAGVRDGGAYAAPWTFFVNGTGLLNGRAVSGETTIQTAGEYELAFWDDPNAPRFLRFTIVSSSPEARPVETSVLVQIGLAIVAVFGLYFIRKRK